MKYEIIRTDSFVNHFGIRKSDGYITVYFDFERMEYKDYLEKSFNHIEESSAWYSTIIKRYEYLYEKISSPILSASLMTTGDIRSGAKISYTTTKNEIVLNSYNHSFNIYQGNKWVEYNQHNYKAEKNSNIDKGVIEIINLELELFKLL